jgi:hypothetical protein
MTEWEELSVELFTHFVEIWRGVSRGDHPGLGPLELQGEEVIIKVMNLVRVLDLGLGALVLTPHRLLFVPSNGGTVRFSRFVGACFASYPGRSLFVSGSVLSVPSVLCPRPG